MAKTVTIEVFVCVDQAGDYGQGHDEARAREQYENDIGPLSDCDGFRMVNILLAVPCPEMETIELTAGAVELGSATGEA